MKYLYAAVPLIPVLAWAIWLSGLPTAPSTAPAPAAVSVDESASVEQTTAEATSSQVYYVGFAYPDGSQEIHVYRSFEAAAVVYPFILADAAWNHSVIDCQIECATDQITATQNCLNRINDEGIACVVVWGTPNMPCVTCCVGLEGSGYDCSGSGYRAFSTDVSDAVPQAVND